MGLYNKYSEPRGSHGTLIGNWLEERALKQASGYQRYRPYKDDSKCLPQTNLRVVEHSANADRPGQKVSVNTSTYTVPPASFHADKFYNLSSYKNEETLINNTPLPAKCTPTTQTFHLFKNYQNVQNIHNRTIYDSSFMERMNTNPHERTNTIPSRNNIVPWYSSTPYLASENPANGPHVGSAYERRPIYEVPPKPTGLFETRRIAEGARRYQQ